MFQKFCIRQPLAVFVFAVAFIVSMCGLSAMAQTSGAGAIAGTIMDVNHAVIPGALVTVTNVDTGIVRSYTTNSSGLYAAPFLQPGHYKVHASAANFGTVEAKDLTLQVGETLTIDLNLTVKSATTTVEVSAAPQMLDLEKTEVSQVVDQELIESLPVNARNWSSFVLLTPGVTQDGGSGLISFHGISGLYNQNYVDGANNNQMLFAEARGRASGAPYVYSVDSIKEFQAETSNYSVEFGQAAGGQVNAITKSGTNNLHGDLFWYLRYPDLNALDPYSKYQALHNNGNPFLLTQPIHQQNQFGGSIGGPFIKDRLFYFFTYDGFRKVGRVLYSDTNTITTTATASNSGGTVISPTQCPATISSALCLAGINFLETVGNVAPGDAPPSRFAKQDLFFPRLDYHVNGKNDAFVDFNFANFTSTNGYSPNPTYSNSAPSTNGPTAYHERFLVGGLTTVISDRSVNQVHAQWGRDLETAGANASGPSVATGVLTFGMPNALPRIAEPDEHRIQITDVFSHSMGRHTLKFGGDGNIVHEVMINLYQGGGIYSYSESTPAASFQDWIQDAFQGQAGNTDPYAGYPLQHLRPDRRCGQHDSRHAGQGRLLDEDVRRLRRGHLEGQPEAYGHSRPSLRCPAHSGARTHQQQLSAALQLLHPDHQERSEPRAASCGLLMEPLHRHRSQGRLRHLLRAQPGQHLLRDAGGKRRGSDQLQLLRVQEQRRRGKRDDMHKRAQHQFFAGVSQRALPADRALALFGSLPKWRRCSGSEWPKQGGNPELPRSGPELRPAIHA